jgi:transposase-like protein
LSGFLQFCTRYSDEDSCIKALSDFRWPQGFVCDKCQHDKSYHLDSRPRIYECANCGHQHSVTAGCIFHKTRTPLRKWFMAMYLIGHDKRGVSAMFISEELDIRYESAWLMCHKIRHALTERDEFRLAEFIEIDETFVGGRRQKGNRGRAHGNGKSLVVAAVEKVLPPKGKKGIKGQAHRAGNARLAVIDAASTDVLGSFIRKNVTEKAWIISDGWRGYRDLGEFHHIPVIQGSGAMAGVNMPHVHLLFSNLKAWLIGTHHGVSAKHLPRYLREFNYRFNRRGMRGELDSFVLRRAVSRSTITYAELIGGERPKGADRWQGRA